jgi:hypothetical protein
MLMKSPIAIGKHGNDYERHDRIANECLACGEKGHFCDAFSRDEDVSNSAVYGDNQEGHSINPRDISNLDTIEEAVLGVPDA